MPYRTRPDLSTNSYFLVLYYVFVHSFVFLIRKGYSGRHISPGRRDSSRDRSHSHHQIRYLSPASYRRTRIGKPGTCLFVAGFGFMTTERELERKFSRFGRVRNVRIIRDRR